jgi:hypothetical protein
MRYHGVMYVLIIVVTMILLLTLQYTELLFDPLILTLPFTLGVTAVFMTLVKESIEADAVFGSIIITSSFVTLFYFYAIGNLGSYNNIFLYLVLIMLSAGFILMSEATKEFANRRN